MYSGKCPTTCFFSSVSYVSVNWPSQTRSCVSSSRFWQANRYQPELTLREGTTAPLADLARRTPHVRLVSKPGIAFELLPTSRKIPRNTRYIQTDRSRKKPSFHNSFLLRRARAFPTPHGGTSPQIPPPLRNWVGLRSCDDGGQRDEEEIAAAAE